MSRGRGQRARPAQAPAPAARIDATAGQRSRGRQLRGRATARGRGQQARPGTDGPSVRRGHTASHRRGGRLPGTRVLSLAREGQLVTEINL